MLISCKDSSVSSESNVRLYQLPGCQTFINQKSGYQKSIDASIIDSCFYYNFEEKLTIDFCVNGNCCPDENRFLITNNIFKDTITVTVTDTAANLCRCMCNYIIHGEFELLSYDSYTVKCVRNEFNSNKLLYTKRIKRTESI